jgi:hypothetical protein
MVLSNVSYILLKFNMSSPNFFLSNPPSPTVPPITEFNLSTRRSSRGFTQWSRHISAIGQKGAIALSHLSQDCN